MAGTALTVTLKGMDELMQVLGLTEEQIRAQVDQAIQNAGIETEAGAKQAAPVDTGRLRSSIQYTPDTLACTVGTDVEYAAPVEQGHVTHSGSHVAAQPFLYPAFEVASQHLQEALKELT